MEQDVPTDDPQSSGTRPAGSANKLFVGGLSWETDEGKLQQHFAKYGAVTEAIVMRDRVTNRPRGFGFISFEDEGAALRAMQDTHVLDGRTVDAKPSVPQGDQSRPRSKKIFVGGLAPETTEADFKDYFEKFGRVIEAQIVVDHQNMRSRGFGFITFEEEASVHKVFAAGSHHELGGKQVEVKNATPKGSGPVAGPLDPRAAYLGGRGMGRGYGDLSGYGMGPGYLPAGGYLLPGYSGYMPYGAFPGMMPMGGFGYAGFPTGYAAAGYGPYGQMQQQPGQRFGGSSSRSGATGIPLRAPPSGATSSSAAGSASAAQPQQPPQQPQQQQQQPRPPGGAAPGSMEQLQADVSSLTLTGPGQQQQQLRQWPSGPGGVPGAL